MTALLTPEPPTETALSPLYGRHVWHETFGLGVIGFRTYEGDGPPCYGVTFSAHETIYGCAIVLLERGLRLLPGRSEVVLYPASVNNEPDLKGLGADEWALRREIAAVEAGLGRAA